ncbi:MAG: hypothetical protein HQL09_09390 [Nitrospirae bacterium]|nr:hypothetical protein [Nitrospirota bacterium]
MPSANNVALLWDESFLWGLMAYKALNALRLPFELVRSEDIKNGILEECALLFVPGGWASNKIKTLGPDGIAKIKEFVSSGGNYLGFCGGAGLATLDGLGLLNIRRKPTKERVPSFNGRIRLNLSEHVMWQGLTEQVFHAWWPSQLLIEGEDIRIAGTYGNALPDSFSSDLNVGDIETSGDWMDMEKTYRIKLDPLQLLNDPAVVEGSYGEGKVLLSLVHFDTPDDANGAIVLKNIWRYLAARLPGSLPPRLCAPVSERPGSVHSGLKELESAVNDLIALGERNFLWFRRNSMLLQWRRGIRGLEYCTLHALIREISGITEKSNTVNITVNDDASRIKELLIPFVEKAKRLLILERTALQNGHITYEKCDDPDIREIRTELFSNSKSYGGLFKELIDQVDRLLYLLLKQNE